ncbi:transposase [Pseudonocardia sp. K10HN5]|uniref:Transposase n=1 Tax=Pseudonocardia acidicola TaxID=2724939 RepID=A0ABX1SMK2_9PSEU|nr:transposase [Pseudonocardia acidicola]
MTQRRTARNSSCSLRHPVRARLTEVEQSAGQRPWLSSTSLRTDSNLQEGRHDLARHVFTAVAATYAAPSTRARKTRSALGLVLNCIALWNTISAAPPPETPADPNPDHRHQVGNFGE